MKAKELLLNSGELSHKLRNKSDLINHIGTKEKGSSNYCVLLGSGASVTSDVRTASILINEWLLDLYERFNDRKPKNLEEAKAYFEKDHASWYNPSNPYSSLFEKKYDLPSQRRRFVEQEVENKLPSIGYAYLISLIDNDFFDTVFTTNFDDLINEAFYQFSNKRPIHCAHDSSIHSISVTSKRPKIIKLHGDYLFDDIKSTLKETESLEQNTKDKLIEFCKEYGLIVLGYSGSDRSIMDVLDFLSKQDNYLKNGVYWCLRNEDEVSHTLRNLFWKDKVFPVLIDGFDDFFAEAHALLVKKNLDIESNIKHSKLQQTVKSILEDNFNLKNNDIIQRELETIKHHSDKQDFSSFINSTAEENEGSSKLPLSDLNKLLEVEELINKKELSKAYKKCEDFYYSASDDNLKAKYVIKLVSINEKLGEVFTALRWADKLIEIDPNNVKFHIIKSDNIKDLQGKYNYLVNLLKKFKYSYHLLNEVCRAAIVIIKNTPCNNTTDVNKVIEFAEKSIQLNPSLENSAWKIKFDTLAMQLNYEVDQEIIKNIKKDISNIVSQVEAMNPIAINTLSLKTNRCNQRKEYDESVKFLEELYELYRESTKPKKEYINELIDDIILLFPEYECKNKCDFKEKMKFFYLKHLQDKDIISNPELSLSKAQYYIGQEKQLSIAKKYIKDAINNIDAYRYVENILFLAKAYDDFDYTPLEKIIDEKKDDYRTCYYERIKSELYIAINKLDDAIKYIEQSFEKGLSLNDYLVNKTFILLKQQKFDDIIILYQKYEDECSKFDSEPFIINVQYAARQLDSHIYNDVVLRNLSARSNSMSVKICAFSILGNTIPAKKMLTAAIDRDYFKKYMYAEWPAIKETRELLEVLT